MKRLSGFLVLAFAVSVFVGCEDKAVEVKKKEDFSRESIKVDGDGGAMEVEKATAPNLDNIDP